MLGSFIDGISKIIITQQCGIIDVGINEKKKTP